MIQQLYSYHGDEFSLSLKLPSCWEEPIFSISRCVSLRTSAHYYCVFMYACLLACN